MADNWRPTLAIGALAAAVFLGGLGLTHLWDEDEPKNAVCGQEMLQRGDWIVPTFNGQLRTDKPILLYWCMLAVYNLLGVSEMTARLPSALAGIGTIILTFHLGRLMFDRRTGLLAGCLAVSALYLCLLARAATPDSLLIFCITASLTAFVAGVAARRGGNFNGAVPVREHGLPVLACMAMYVSIGLAVLAKGPIGVVMPLGIIGCYLLLFDGIAAAPAEWGRLRRTARYFAPHRVLSDVRTLRLAWGLPLVVAIALPWYVAVGIKTNGEWLRGFLGTHNVGRFMQPMEHHRGLPIYYLVAILLGFFPGSVFLPAGMWSMVGAVRRRLAHRSAAAFLLCWIWCYLGFFTLAATKLPNYVVPCYPALAIVTGRWLSALLARRTARNWQVWAGYGSLAAAGVAATVALAVLAHVYLNGDVLVALPGLVAVIGGIICLAMAYRGQLGRSVGVFIATSLAFTSSAMIYTAWRANAQQEGPLLAERISAASDAAADEGPRVATFNYFTPSLVYYLGHPISRLGNADEVTKFFDEGGDAVVLPRTVYETNRAALPADLTVVAEATRLFRKTQVVVVSKTPQVARGPSGEQAR